MYKSLCAALSIFLFSNLSHASGVTVRDGGYGVACDGKLELLDIYESRHLYHANPLPDSAQYSLHEIIAQWGAIAMKAVGDNPDLATAIGHAIEISDHPTTFFWDKSFAKLVPYDVGFLRIIPPPPCFANVPLAYFESNKGYFLPSFHIDEKLWNKLDNLNKAALILHEALHAYFNRDINSLAIRQFMTYVTAPDVLRSTYQSKFEELVQNRYALFVLDDFFSNVP